MHKNSKKRTVFENPNMENALIKKKKQNLTEKNDIRPSKFPTNKPKILETEAEISTSEEPKIKKTKKETANSEVSSSKEVFTSESFDTSLRTYKNLAKLGYKTMTNVQSLAMEPMMNGENLIVQAKTGSGKSLAYLIPIVETILDIKAKFPSKKGPFVIVLVPVRELTQQLSITLDSITQGITPNITSICVTGGRSDQSNSLKKNPPDIIFANPGRFFQYVSIDKSLEASYFRNIFISVLDEADSLLDMGFVKHVQAIMAVLPKARQNVYYSATFPTSLKKIFPEEELGDLKHIKAFEENAEVAVSTLENHYIMAKAEEFNKTLLGLMNVYKGKKVVVFVATRKGVELYTELLNASGFECISMKGNMRNNKRMDAYDDFKNAKKGILLSTDVSARGVDYPDVDLVLVVGMPTSPDIFVHQSGRTARAGKSGKCIALLYTVQHKFIKSCMNKKIKFVSELQPTDYVKEFEKLNLNLHTIFNKIDPNTKFVYLQIMIKEMTVRATKCIDIHVQRNIFDIVANEMGVRAYNI